MAMRYRNIISYGDIVKREEVLRQRGMNFRINRHYSIIMMTVKEGVAPRDQWHEDTGLLEYEGHDVVLSQGNVDPRGLDQPMRYRGGGHLTENGKFYEAAEAHRDGGAEAEMIQVYEKIAQGVWCDRGRYGLVDAKIVFDGQRNVFRFFLRPAEIAYAKEPFLREAIMIQTVVKVEVWKRDRGSCGQCGSTKNLHFDHDMGVSKGGGGITAENVRVLCAKHNL